MAKFNNFSAGQRPVIDKVYRAARIALEKATADLGSDASRQIFKIILGGGAVSDIKKAEQMLATTVKLMHSRVATLSFSVEYDASLATTHENANMLSFAGADLGEVTNTVDDWRARQVGSGMMPMKLGPAFFAMPFRDLFEQSQIETFLHELSHHSAGTIDDKNGGECYGWTGVTRLKGLGPIRAVRNAENVGFYCTYYA